ncbi:MAG: ABC-F family ATP-binding cassette domain-containing protein [Gemmataceae bacterium]
MSVLVSARGLTKSFGPRPLFAGVNLELRADDKLGLIGPNGAGKSTLLKILHGREVAEEGEVAARRGTRMGYLAQDDQFPAGQTVREVLLLALEGTALEDHERETQAAITLTQLGFADPDQPAGTLSGGWRKRLALGRELIRNPDYLLIDEPTNHLDLPGVVWLEKLLRGAKFGFLVTTHDRAFLRNVTSEIIEINRVYPDGTFRAEGNYDDFQDKKDAFLEAQSRMRDAVANQVRKETEWLGRKESAQRRKSRSRIQEAADRRAELAELNYRSASVASAGIDFAGTGRQTRKLMTATGLAKTLGGRVLFQNVDVELMPGMRLGLLGANGSGKSTLLKLLAGQLPSDGGTITTADRLRTVVFEQGRSSLNLNVSLRRSLAPNTETVMFQDRPLHVGAWAQRFLFKTEQLDLELSALSGGEQARVRIAQLMLQPADVLFLDEPTNDLDIPSLEVLEESLDEFPGAVVIVSHDRDLLDRLCTDIIGLDGQGIATKFGSVAQWLAALPAPAEIAKPNKASSTPAAGPKPKKLSYKEQQEWDGMEAAVMTAEETFAARQKDVEAAATSGAAKLRIACEAMEAAQAKVEALYARWQELEAKRAGTA